MFFFYVFFLWEKDYICFVFFCLEAKRMTLNIVRITIILQILKNNNWDECNFSLNQKVILLYINLYHNDSKSIYLKSMYQYFQVNQYVGKNLQLKCHFFNVE